MAALFVNVMARIDHGAAGRSAQEQFGAALLDGFTPEELEHMQRSLERIRKNVEKYLEDKNNDNVD